ncbi:MAG: NAD-dependent epimerase/dehydratase family protein [bacterium]
MRDSVNQQYLLREAVTGVDVVFHLIWTTIPEVANRDPAGDVSANLIPTIRLFEVCRNVGVRRIVFVSSGGTVYGPAQTWPVSEAHPQNPINSYGITKLAAEKYLYMFRHLYGVDYVIFRPSVPYGPRQNPLAAQGAVAVFLYRVARGLPVTIWGDGSVVRDYFYVSDLTSALVAGAERASPEQRVFNLGGGNAVSLIQLLGMVEEVVGKRANVEYAPPRRFDAPQILLDTNLARQELGWQPKVRLTDGLVQTWKWMSITI